MKRLIITDRFKKNLRQFTKKHPDLTHPLQEVFKLLVLDPINPQLRVHKLTGKLNHHYAASLTYEYRLVFQMTDDSIIPLAIGTHDEVY